MQDGKDTTLVSGRIAALCDAKMTDNDGREGHIYVIWQVLHLLLPIRYAKMVGSVPSSSTKIEGHVDVPTVPFKATELHEASLAIVGQGQGIGCLNAAPE